MAMGLVVGMVVAMEEAMVEVGMVMGGVVMVEVATMVAAAGRSGLVGRHRFGSRILGLETDHWA